jgi:hypothetical protein
VVDEELEAIEGEQQPEEEAGDEPGTAGAEDPTASTERASSYPRTPAVPPPRPQDEAKKGHSGIVRIGKRRRPTPPG